MEILRGGSLRHRVGVEVEGCTIVSAAMDFVFACSGIFAVRCTIQPPTIVKENLETLGVESSRIQGQRRGLKAVKSRS